MRLVYLDPPDNKQPLWQSFVYTNAYDCGPASAGTIYDGRSRGCVRVIPAPAPDNPHKNSSPPPCQDPKKAPPKCGNPINPSNGNKYQSEADYVSPLSANSLSLVRHYSSNPFSEDAKRKRSFGKRWTHRYDVMVTRESQFIPDDPVPPKCYQRVDTLFTWCEYPAALMDDPIPVAVSITRPGGNKNMYSRTSGNVWKSDSDINDRLTATFNADNSLVSGWTHVTAQGDEIERFEGSSLISITSRNGTVQRLTYSTGGTNDTNVSRMPADAPVCSRIHPGKALPSGYLLCVTDNWGRQLHFEYEIVGDENDLLSYFKAHIVKTIDPAQQETLYAYDGPSSGCFVGTGNTASCADNNLTSVTYPDGKTKTYYYNEISNINNGSNCYAKNVGNGFGHLRNALTGIVDENGARFASWGYNCNGDAWQSWHAGGTNKVALIYGDVEANGVRSSGVSYTSGHPGNPMLWGVEFVFKKILGVFRHTSTNTSGNQACDDCGPIKSKTYDANGNVASATDWNNNKTCYAYDLTRNLETARVDGLATGADCPATLAAASLTAPARKITTQWHATFRLPVMISEPKRQTRFDYDPSGNLLVKAVFATNDATGVQGLAAVTVGTPRRWESTYNGAGQVLTVKGPRTDVNDTTTYAYDAATGNLISITNPAGHVTTLTHYDAHGRVGRIVDANGLTTDLVYAPRGWLTNKIVTDNGITETTRYDYDGVGQLKTVTLPDGATIAYTYDDAHRLTDITDSRGNTIHYTLDWTGNRIKEEVKDPTGNLARQVSRVFDALSRLQQVTGGAQ
jgi:YD repeat-containing protein